MAKYLLRMNCEYTLIVEADNHELAEDIADGSDMEAWDSSWSEMDCEKIGGEEDVYP